MTVFEIGVFRGAHIVVADNAENGETIVITAYEPDVDRWFAGISREKKGPVVKCVICKHGITMAGVVTVTLERNGTTLIIRSVPAQVCANCGEEYLDESTSEKLLRAAEDAANDGVEIDIRQFHAA